MLAILFGIFLLTLLMITAVGIVRSENLFAATILMGLFSLQIAAVFFTLDAADVALTEAAVGAGVSTVLFLSALALTRDRERPVQKHRAAGLVVTSIMTALILFATFDKPSLGDPDAPVHQHLAPWYMAETPERVGIPNVVTAILASFRGYDTLGELFVIFTAGIGVLFILGDRPLQRGRLAPDPDAQGLRHHLIPQVVGRLLVPFILLFALYIQFHGDYGPGGGFQAGALAAAGMILHALIDGEAAALRTLPRDVLTWMAVCGALLYMAVGLAGPLLGGNFLDYSVLGGSPLAGQHLGILLIELGVGLTVAGILLLIFHAFAARAEQA